MKLKLVVKVTKIFKITRRPVGVASRPRRPEGRRATISCEKRIVARYREQELSFFLLLTFELYHYCGLL